MSAQEEAVAEAQAPAVIVPTDLTEVITAVANVDKVAAGLAELRAKYAGVVYDVATTEGLDAAREARRVIRAPRYELEKLRKAAKAPILALGKQIDARAETITEQLLVLETPIDDQIKKREAEVEAARQAKVEAERKRVEALRQKLQNIAGAPARVANQRASIIRTELEDLQSLVIEEDEYAEFTEQARATREVVLQQLTTLHAERQAFEAEQERIRQEREQLEADRRRQEQEAAAERQRQAAAKAKQEAEERARREQQEREDRERRERIEAEDRERRERQAREDAERRAEAERLEAQRRELEEQAEAQRQREAAARPPKCDGNHGGPRCADPECWNDEDPNAPTVVNPEAWPAPGVVGQTMPADFAGVPRDKVTRPLDPTGGPLEPEMPRPTNDQLVQAIADVFDVSGAVAREWLIEFADREQPMEPAL